jgi:predicted nucleic acid-binding Zn ribbon protein
MALVEAGEVVACHVCGRPTLRGARFCSRKCWGRHRSNVSVSRPSRACEMCGKPVGRQATRCCSKECYGAYRSTVFVGAANQHWRGGLSSSGSGSRRIVVVANGRHGQRTRYRYEHIVVAETALGKPLPVGAVVHHVNGDMHDNRPANLLICQDRSYHSKLHARDRKRKANR